MQLTLIEHSDTLTHVALEGALDLGGVGKVSNTLTIQICTPRKPAIIDMSKVDMVSSLGMGLLVSCARALAKHQQKLVLLNVQPRVAEALTSARLQELLVMVSGVEEARKKLGVG